MQAVLYTEATWEDDEPSAAAYTAYEDDAEVGSAVAARKAARSEAVQAAIARHEVRKTAGVAVGGERELV